MSGRRKVEEIVPAERLQAFRALRASPKGLPHSSGEPDLFLYQEDEGSRYKFVEVKKESDRLSKRQLLCISQILATLSCEVDIVYLRERRRSHKPKVYLFDALRGHR